MKKQRILSLLLILAISFTYNIGFAEDTGSEPQLFQAEAVEAAQENGIMVMSVSKDLNISMDCQKLTINDELGRMVRYDKLGINDVAHMYWIQLVHGNNSFLFYGNCDFRIKHIEARKVGE